MLLPDQSVPVKDDYNVRQRSGTLIDLYKSAQSPAGKALNALDFPMQCAEHPPHSFATDVKAWTRTLRSNNQADEYPTTSTRWGIAATSGSYHRWHVDTDGFGTWLDCKTGGKVWFIAIPKAGNGFTQFAARDLFQADYSMESNNLHLWNVEAVLLTPGTRL